MGVRFTSTSRRPRITTPSRTSAIRSGVVFRLESMLLMLLQQEQHVWRGVEHSVPMQTAPGPAALLQVTRTAVRKTNRFIRMMFLSYYCLPDYVKPSVRMESNPRLRKVQVYLMSPPALASIEEAASQQSAVAPLRRTAAGELQGPFYYTAPERCIAPCPKPGAGAG